jgi:hypothetical protein
MALPFIMAIWKLISIENRNANNGGGRKQISIDADDNFIKPNYFEYKVE